MRLYQRLAFAAAISLGVCLGTSAVQAQNTPIWSSYDVQYVNQFYNPLAGATLIPVTDFHNFTGGVDPDDGVAINIPVGFSFEYNGRTYNSVNVCVNGWIQVQDSNHQLPIPITPNNNANLFSPTDPNNTIAPFWGDHYYRTLEPGYTPSRIQYQTTATIDPNSTTLAYLHVFTVEWKNLNINDKSNPYSVASFQVKIVENADANMNPADHRATIEFHYGPIGTTGTVQTVGATVGIEDSVGFTHMNALFPTSQDDEADTRSNVTARTSSWPPAVGLPGRIVQFVPEGRGSYAQWGDGDVTLDQLLSPDPLVRTNQSLFVTLADADKILQSRAWDIPLDSVEGREAFHGDANHTGRVYSTTYGEYFYYANSYDAAYIMMYLAAKVPELPWPDGLPIPGYKATGNAETNISGIMADANAARLDGNTVLVPVELRGTVNGPLSVEMTVTPTDANALQFIGTRAINGSLMRADAVTGKVAFATTGTFADHSTLGYLEFQVTDMSKAGFTLGNISINDKTMPSTTTSLNVEAGVSTVGTGYALGTSSPNPFNVSVVPQTVINFTLPTASNVSVHVYDLLGHEVRTLIANESRPAGVNTIAWDGHEASGNLVAAGSYYYELVAPGFTKTAKLQVIR